MPAVRVVQVPVDEVVDVVAVRHALVAAARPMLVRGVVPVAAVPRRAGVGVRAPDGEAVLVDLVAAYVMQVPVVQVVAVALVFDARMAATCAVGMAVVVVFRRAHVHTPLPGAGS